MKNYNDTIARILFSLEITDGQRLKELSALLDYVYEEGYDQAARDITTKLQDCIPSASRTVEEARLKGAWTDAASIALNFLGRLSGRQS